MIATDLQSLATPIERLSLLPGNPRRGDVDALAASLGKFGQRKPIVARRDGTVIAGNHTLLAARRLGWEQVAVVWVDDDDTTAKAFALADNRIGSLGGYDDEELAALIKDVGDVDAELLAAAGWADDAVTDLLSRACRRRPIAYRSPGMPTTPRHRRPTRSLSPAMCGCWVRTGCCAATPPTSTR